jgi:hypothetical protein
VARDLQHLGSDGRIITEVRMKRLVFGAAAGLSVMLVLSTAYAAWIRERGRPHVYYVGAGFYCHVISEEQLASYGLHWTQTDELSPSEYQQLVAGLRFDGSCKWANGCYRKSDERAVYRVSESNACWVTSEAELPRQCPGGVRTITSSVRDLHAYTGACQ